MGDDAKSAAGKQGACLEVTFKSDAEMRQAGGHGVFDKEREEVLAQVFDPAQLERLRGLELEVLAWIRRDPKHAAAYLTDPFGCLERAGLVDDPALLEKMRQLAAGLKTAGGDAQPAIPQGVTVRVR